MANRRKDTAGRKDRKPTVIDATATEVDPSAQDEVTGADAADRSGAEASGENEAETRAESDTGEEPHTEDVGPAESDDSATSGAKTSGPASTPEKRGGSGKWVAAGLAAMLLAGVAGGGYLYHTYGAQLFGPQQPVADLAGIESQVMDATGAAQSASQAAGEANSKVSALTERIDGVEQQLSQLKDAPAKASPAAAEAARQAGAALKATDDLASRLSATGKGVEDLRTSMQALQKAVADAASNGGGIDQTAINLKLEELTQRLDKLEARPVTSGEASQAELDSLKQQLAANDQRIADLSAQLDAATAQIKTLSEQPAQSAGNDLAGMATAIAALSTAADAGKPYAAELAALRDTAPAAPALPALDANAEGGIATAKSLRDQLAGLTATLKQDQETQPAQSSGFLGALQDKLTSVVKVRSLGEHDWPAAVTRAIDAFDKGGLEAAIAVLPADADAMPDELKAWLIEARKRVAANSELERLPQQLLSAPADQSQ